MHERHHALNQSLRWTKLAYGYTSLTGTSNVSKNSWSFNLRPGAPLTPAGRKWNHKTFDADTDDAYDPEDANAGTPVGDVEQPAYNSEPRDENALAFRDWGAPGKMHAAVNDYND